MLFPMQKIITVAATVLAILVGGAHMRAVEETALKTELHKAIHDMGSDANLQWDSGRRMYNRDMPKSTVSEGTASPGTLPGVMNEIDGDAKHTVDYEKMWAALQNIQETMKTLHTGGTITTSTIDGKQKTDFYNPHGPPLREIGDVQPLIQAAYYSGVAHGAEEMLRESGMMQSLGPKVKELFSTNWAAGIGRYMDNIGDSVMNAQQSDK